MKSFVVALGIVGLAACVEVPERTDPPSADDGVLDAASDMQPGPRADGSMGDRDDAAPPDMAPPPDMALAPDAADLDAMVDAASDAEPDAMPDAVVDAVIDAEIDAEWPDLGPPGGVQDSVLVFSDCLEVAVEMDVIGAEDPPCLQVARGTDSPDLVLMRTGLPLDDGRILLFGGFDIFQAGQGDGVGGNPPTGRTLVYDPVTDRYALSGGLPPRSGYAALTYGGRPTVLGGTPVADAGGEAQGPSNEVFVREGNRWVPAEPLSAARSGAAAWIDAQNQVGLVGGVDADGELALPVVSWPRGAVADDDRLAEGRLRPSLVVAERQPLVVGGVNSAGTAVASAEWRRDDGTWSLLPREPLLARAEAASAVVPTGPLVAGGRSHGLDYDGGDAVLEYDSVTTFVDGDQLPGDLPFDNVERPDMTRARWGFTLSHIGPSDTQALAVGGARMQERMGNGMVEDVPTLVELYDAPRDRWIAYRLVFRPDGQIVAGLERRLHTAVTNSFGWVIVTGGRLPSDNGLIPGLVFTETLIFRIRPDSPAPVE